MNVDNCSICGKVAPLGIDDRCYTCQGDLDTSRGGEDE